MADEQAATELKLYIDNDADLYRRQRTPIDKNLVTKKARGQYKHDLAVKLFGYLVESGAKKYAKEFGTPDQPWHRMFDASTRRLVAEELARDFEAEANLGNYDHLLPKKYHGTSASPASGRVVISPSGTRSHSIKKKSPAQLNREIAESLGSRRERW